MTASPQEPQFMTEAEYLEFERLSELKHEFYQGEIFAMTGASRAHNVICTYTSSSLINALGEKPCEVYQSDMRVRVSASGLYTYPDVMVVCGDPKFSDDQFDTIVNPIVIIDVLSPSTESYDDRGKKFQDYRTLKSLQEYLLISQDKPLIERYIRSDHGEWIFGDAQGLEASLTLTSIDCILRLSDVYRKVDFDDLSD